MQCYGLVMLEKKKLSHGPAARFHFTFHTDRIILFLLLHYKYCAPSPMLRLRRKYERYTLIWTVLLSRTPRSIILHCRPAAWLELKHTTSAMLPTLQKLRLSRTLAFFIHSGPSALTPPVSQRRL